MNCSSCDSPKSLKKSRIDMPYTQSGLNNIWLKGVAQWKCDHCGETYKSFGDMDQLHGLIAGRLVSKKGHLTGAETRFLRKTMGYNSAMFAKLLGVSAAHLSRIENAPEAKLKSAQLDHALRFIVASKNATPDRDYDLHDQIINDEGTEMSEILIEHKKSGWKNSAPEAHP